MESLEHLEISKVILSVAAHRQAEAFCSQQKDPSKAEQVYLNTLAIYAVDEYLRSLGISTALDESDSVQIVNQTLTNGADLRLPDIGQLECRLIDHDAEAMYVPEEVWGDRIGYIAVQLSEDCSEASLLGFVKAVDSISIPLSKLESLSAFLDYLEQLETQTQAQEEQVLVTSATRFPEKKPINRLSQWLDHTLESGWQLIEDIKYEWSTPQSEPAIAFRHARASQNVADSELIQYGKSLNFNQYGEENNIQLVVGLRSQPNHQYQVRVRLYPAGDRYLTPGLEVSLVNNIGKVVSQNQMPPHQPYFEMMLGLNKGDSFGVRISDSQTTAEESFAF